ncbi:phage tail tape measure protein [Gottfriedia sp. S16(2024)]|uniref:phage tail tape measure protein n=1 Tax=Gottfriedia sp. S16(2024) TaxID=3162883 RepID=UPI003D1EA320
MDVVKTLGLMVTAGAAAGVAMGAVNKAMDFESQMSTIKALTGATNEEMSQMQKLALDMGAKTKYSALEAAQGIEELLKAGLTPATVQAGGLEAALNLATAGGLELADAAEIMSTALNSFKADSMSAADASNILAGTANASATSVQELRYSLASVAAVAAGVGLTFKDTNAALGVFANNGLKGSDAGTSLKTMLMNLQPKTKAQFEEFERLGLITFSTTQGMNILRANGVKPLGKDMETISNQLRKVAAKMAGAKVGSEKAEKEFTKMAMQTSVMGSAFYDANGSIRSTAEIAETLQVALGGMTDAQRQASLYTMFGSDAIRAANILYKEGAEGVSEFTKEMSKVTAFDVAKEKMNNAAGAVEQFKGAMETLQIAVLLPLMPVIKDAANAAADFVGNLDPATVSGWGESIKTAGQTLVNIATLIIDNWGPIKETIIAVTTAVVAYKTAMLGLTIISGIITLITNLRIAYGLLTGAQWALNVAMDANPIGAVILAISALIGVSVLLYRNWDIVSQKASQLWAKIGPLQGVFLALLGPIGAVVSAVRTLVSVWNNFKSSISNFKMPKFSLPKFSGGVAGFLGSGKSHAGGLSNVPYNGYQATLHKGERVLTPEENDAYNRGGKGGSQINISGNTFNVRKDSDIKQIAYELSRLIEKEGAWA